MSERRHLILVIDDDADASAVLRSWYAGRPFEFLHAADGAQGLEAARSARPDLILLDITMPVLDGLEVARALKADPATSGIPVILLTAHRDLRSKVDAFGLGADDYVTKPYEFDEVDARIVAMLRKRELYLALEESNRRLAATNQHLEELLITDDKTGLANYRHFCQRLRDEFLRAARYRTPLSVVMLDLDDFKLVNDRLGHPAGDRALREVATIVAGGARATDLAARYGGEEFALILPHTDAGMSARVAERILAALRDHTLLEDSAPTRITASAGVATYPSSEPLDSPEALVQAADHALYRAKERGKNQVAIHGAAQGVR